MLSGYVVQLCGNVVLMSQVVQKHDISLYCTLLVYGLYSPLYNAEHRVNAVHGVLC